MPRRDGTGPMGMGERTGRGAGFCSAAKIAGTIGGLGLGLGLGLRRGCRRGLGLNNYNDVITPENQKKLLMEQKSILEEKLNYVKEQLNNLEKDK
ncbi:hypothetical protein CLOACE_22840 [Clostridium acetireducens DSM 10703]|jgi:hypothetical protein|uniref:DUF5320 domain-containing protein n=1 Tax=Clostridium acetireducens DSM 10703 TaxID=1121290 RepID=A0A1E8EUT8_9CLOT|nr:DUF5320 domain-containing protein [Clostridium acetireducens]OFH97999.1 hypothetical protein CLOACE_22840 [Clostridium acetireducens DSM 10703]